MSQVRRLYIAKREGYDIDAQALTCDLKDNLRLDGLRSVRIAHRYDVQGLSQQQYAGARDQFFHDPMTQDAYDEELPCAPGERRLVCEFLPGQYDQRADSLRQCAQVVSQGECIVRAAKVYRFFGEITDDEFVRVKAHIINPIESREASEAKPDTLADDFAPAADVAVVDGFCSLSDDLLGAMRAGMEMAMTQEDLRSVQAYFRDEERRDPTATELRMIDTYWSDHCRHTTFLTTLEEVTFEQEGLAAAIERSFLAYLADREELGRQNPPCLMDIALAGPRLLKKRGQLAGVDESEEINACSIRVTVQVDGQPQDWLVMFKNETHNHPTEIEPFGGAATCLGGAIRDPLSGRAYVYHALRVTGSGDPTAPIEETLPGKLPQRRITTTAASGFSSYGNQIGLAAGQINEVYHPGFVAKRMELGAVVAAAPADNVVRERPQPGDVVILLGGRTGRDGLGGATGSSKEHTEDSLAECGAQVQKGNAALERNIQRLFCDPSVTKLIRRCNDFGAGGVSVAIGELADGLLIDLDKVPAKYDGLDGTELAISESQERMAVVVAQGDAQALIDAAQRENLEATIVATVTEEPRLRMRWRGEPIVDIARSFLDTNGAEQRAKAHVVSPDPRDYPYSDRMNLRENWIEALSDLNVASQQGLAERFDSTAGAATVLMPFGGARQRTPIQAMAAKLPAQGDTDAATVMAYGYDPFLSSWSPYHGAMAAVVESLSRIAAAGGDTKNAYLTFQEYFERLRDEPARWGKPVAALLGALEAQKELSVASIGGKDSMSGSFMDLDVPPTLVSFAICVADATDLRSGEFKQAGNRIIYLPARLDEDMIYDWEYQSRLLEEVSAGIRSGTLQSAHTVGIGGIAAAVSKMAFGNWLGAEINSLPLSSLFTPRYGSFVLEATDRWSPGDFDFVELGVVTPDAAVRSMGVDLALSDLLEAYERPLRDVFPILGPTIDRPIADVASIPAPAARKQSAIAKPRALIPVFPGTSNERDVVGAFARAGAQAETLVIRNLTPDGLAQSLIALEEAVRGAQILTLCGGFGAWDEPEGAAKYLIALMSHPRIKDAVTDLLTAREGLILGLGSGFQALVKLGLAPYGEYREEAACALTTNAIGRHISHIANVRLSSKLSPWYALSDIGECRPVAIANAEGRLIASEDELQRLAQSGQIATQYADADGKATMDPRYNLTGSALAVESLCSPDGRVLGKLGHPERSSRPGVLVNIPGEKEDRLFLSGVRYFA